ncbi:MAG: hypothetical protein LBT59_23030 [Clostridiales bacterium]|nr:hypothetical protein [Clostridiales bacterium]
MKSCKTFLSLLLILAVLSASLTGCASNMEDEFNPQNLQLAPGSDDSSVTGASEDSDVAATNEPYVAINEVYAAAKEAYAAVNEPDVTDSEPDAATSEPDAATSEPYAPTSEPYAPTSEPYAATSEPYAPTSEPDAATSEPDAATSEPDVPDSEPDAATSEPDAPDNEVYVPDNEPDAATNEPDAATSEPDVTDSETYATTRELYMDDKTYADDASRYRDILDDNGYWRDVRAQDLVELFDINAVPIPASVLNRPRLATESSNIHNYILFDLIANTPVSSVPDALIQYVIDGKINYYLTSASYKQMPLEDYLAQFANASSLEEAVKNAFDKDIKNFKTYLVTQAIAEKAGIVVANDELPPDYANLTRDDETYENIYLKPYITQWVLKDKVVDYLTKHAIYE